MATKGVVLVGPDRTGHALLVMPLEQVISDLGTLSLFAHGRTFGRVRADATQRSCSSPRRAVGASAAGRG